MNSLNTLALAAMTLGLSALTDPGSNTFDSSPRQTEVQVSSELQTKAVSAPTHYWNVIWHSIALRDQ